MLFVGHHDAEDIRNQSFALGIKLERSELAVVAAERPQMSKWISAGDVGTCFILPKYFSLAVSPTKLGEYLACGVPTIANGNVGDVEAVIDAVDGGHVLKDFNDAEFSDAADAFFRLLERDRSEIRESARKLLDLPLAIDAYRRIYSDISTAVVAGIE
jgi:glycosyltransferase involved in cell wall biosynthesis